MRHEVLTTAMRQLQELGFDAAASREPEGLDGEPIWDAVLTRTDLPAWRWPVEVTELDSLTLTHFRKLERHADDSRSLLIGPKVSNKSAEQFRTLGVSFIDVAGNAFLRHGGVLVDVRGRTAKPGVSAVPERDSDVNIFSLRRAQVVFTLLTWPWTFSAPRRTVAKIAGVSTGLVSEVMDALRADEVFGTDLEPGATKRDQLVDQWTAAFSSGLGAARRARTFAAQTLDVRPVPGVEVFRSGEAESPWLRASTLSLWVRPWSSKLALENRWRASTTPNVWVREAFWADPHPYRAGIRSAPPLLVYSELMAVGDSRSREAAMRVREETGLVDELA